MQIHKHVPKGEGKIRHLLLVLVTLLVTVFKKELSLELLSQINKCSLTSQNIKDFMLII